MKVNGFYFPEYDRDCNTVIFNFGALDKAISYVEHKDVVVQADVNKI